MRVVWRDSARAEEYKPIRYRKMLIWGTPKGWETTIPGDYNLYANHYCAQNAIDQHIDGEYGHRGTEKRKRNGIKIIGQKKKPVLRWKE